jgi:hypothetical protein
MPPLPVDAAVRRRPPIRSETFLAVKERSARAALKHARLASRRAAEAELAHPPPNDTLVRTAGVPRRKRVREPVGRHAAGTLAGRAAPASSASKCNL